MGTGRSEWGRGGASVEGEERVGKGEGLVWKGERGGGRACWEGEWRVGKRASEIGERRAFCVRWGTLHEDENVSALTQLR